jgi:hypothetical protein
MTHTIISFVRIYSSVQVHEPYVPDLDLSLSVILIPLFQTSVTGSDKLGWDHVAVQTATPTLSCYRADHSQLSQALSFIT